MAQKIAILGTGSVGRTFAERLTSLGYDVTIGTRNVDDTLVKTKTDSSGNVPLTTWLEERNTIRLATFTEAAQQASILFNCTKGDASVDVLTAAGAENLDGKILIDVANPLDFSNGFPPSLSVCNTNSLAEEIQRAFPSLRVVKTLNTMTAALMVNPALLVGDHAVFVCGNDEGAKQETAKLLEVFGWKSASIIDLGDITNARATEMLLPIWVRLYGKFKTPIFNFQINTDAAGQ
ncbi:NAD(P)-binding domain-containing protein [Spirosoma sp. BT702]|uniref:NAD(P)-binding domain-containing protein n=1 Tax=Spirosoma profusum TaxID=2771354 RepID=A0A927ATK0_9BACT|nr:NAD(P)-binding domain-containing protein [Spirosoma profusum]MBD2703710.1 NAD(P)-binding domain-containing protein [Spirosoma profusum]